MACVSYVNMCIITGHMTLKLHTAIKMQSSCDSLSQIFLWNWKITVDKIKFEVYWYTRPTLNYILQDKTIFVGTPSPSNKFYLV